MHAMLVSFPAWSIEMGRMHMLRMARIRIAHICPLCPGIHVGDERHSAKLAILSARPMMTLDMASIIFLDDSHGPWGQAYASFDVAPTPKECSCPTAAPSWIDENLTGMYIFH